jgi:alginate O-acetyltransferase complex protein AlgI
MVTLLVAGLWHGAAWHFVLWGGYLGVVMSIERLLGIRPLRFKERPWLSLLRTPAAFLVFSAGAVLFRAPDLHVAGAVCRQMFAGVVGAPLLNSWQIGLALITLALAILEEWLGWFGRLCRGPAWAYAAACAILLLAVELLGFTEAAAPFIYFQF